MAGTSSELEDYLTGLYGDVGAHFTMDKVPEGAAPLAIRERWLGVPLPVRMAHLGELALGPQKYVDMLSQENRVNDEPVSVAGQDAVHALYVAERWDASDFWVPYQLGLFVFRQGEGVFEPVSAEV